MKHLMLPLIWIVAAFVITGCATSELPPSKLQGVSIDEDGNYLYRLGVGDEVNVFVWANSEVTGDYLIGPDGRINVALLSPIPAAGLTTKELQDKLAASLSLYIKEPRVSVMLKRASGNINEQVKVIGQAIKPAALPYRHGMTVLDLMISVGGLSRYAAGNDAKLIRVVDGSPKQYNLRLEDLLEDGDMNANVDLLPGDVIRIPEAWF
jgi:polysaccharide export outer membrane protein|tara:strand:+ start:75 stop:698 length:624 start_codon:yes stop_codon:yes gene_type:complete